MDNKRYAEVLLVNACHGGSANKYVQQCMDQI